ncbi:hypothetical protein CCP3SC1_1960002 [Gammaproteobacteria bacterium]
MYGRHEVYRPDHCFATPLMTIHDPICTSSSEEEDMQDPIWYTDRRNYTLGVVWF